MKQELDYLKVKVAKKGEAIENMEKINDQWRSELEQLEYTISIWPTSAEKKDSLVDRQKSTLRNEKAKTKATEKCLFEFRKKNIMNRPATLFEILLAKSSASKDQIKQHYHKMNMLTHPDAGGDEEFFMTINRLYQILTNDAEPEAYNIFRLDEAEKVMKQPKLINKLSIWSYKLFV